MEMPALLSELLQHGFGVARIRVVNDEPTLEEVVLSLKPESGEDMGTFLQRVYGRCRNGDQLEIVAERGKITWARIRRS
jgi:hypothetical protein